MYKGHLYEDILKLTI